MSLPLETKVLVVDDFESMRRIVKQVLNDIGFKDVSLADDGATALPMLKSGNFGLLITDWNMPQMEGIDLVKAVRADPRIKSTPILMVTAEAKREQIIQAAQAGVNDYIVKPFTPDTLKAKIEKIFKALGK
ncbi:MAG: chemotaxis response regulator CheY [Gammaproteobacteria bacterium]|jgi:two-component system chemotaxis response regulator CheY